MSKSNKKKRRNFKREVANFFSNADINSAFIGIQHDFPLLSRSEWWEHQEVISLCLGLSDSGLNFKPLIGGFLGQPKYRAIFDTDLIHHFLCLDPDFTIEKIRYHKLFLEEEIFKPLMDWGNDLPQYEDLFGQFRYLFNHNQKVEETLIEREAKLASYEWIELLSLLSIWWQEDYVMNNIVSRQVRRTIDPFAGEMASIAIRSKLKANHEIPQWEDPMPLMEKFLEILNRCGDSQFWNPFKELMDGLKAYMNWVQTLDSFAWQGHRLIKLENGSLTVLPETIEKETKWQRIGHQYFHLEDFFQRVGLKMLPPERRGIPGLQEPLNPGHQLRWRSLAIPQKVKIDGNEIDLEEAVLFLTALNSFHSSRFVEKFGEVFQDAILKEPTFPTRKAIEDAIFGRNLWVKPMMGPLNITTIDYMVNRVSGYTTFDQPMNNNRIEKAMDFLSLDMTKCPHHFNFNLQEFPFLKFGKVVFYFTSNLVVGNSSTLVQNRIYAHSKTKDRNLINIMSDNFEEHIQFLFCQANFETLKGVKLKDDAGKDLTDIDVLVREGNEVLVVQVKNTFSRNQIKSIEDYRNTLEYAGHQTDVAINYLEKNKDEFFNDKFIGIDPDKVKIKGLVISSTPEGNYDHYGKGKYPKISAFELGILLTIKKWELIDWQEEAVIMDLGSREAGLEKYAQILTGNYDGNGYEAMKAAMLRQQENMQSRIDEDCDTWYGGDPSISVLLDRIETDWLWDEVIFLHPMDFPSENDPQNVKGAFVEFQLGRISKRENNFKNAILKFKKAHELHPTDPEYLGHYADTLAENGQKEESILLYNKQIREFPKYFHAYYNRGLTFIELQKYPEALKDFEKALELKPGHVVSLQYCFSLKLFLDDQEIDLMDLERLVKMGRAEMWVVWPFLTKNLAKINQIVDKEDTTIEDLLKVAEIYSHMQDHDSAMTFLNKILEGDPTNVVALFNRGWHQVVQGYSDAALEDFRNAVMIDPNHSRSWDQIGTLEFKAENIEEAESAYLKALDVKPNLPIACRNYGVFLVKNGRVEEGIKWLEKAVPDILDGIPALIALGHIHEQAENWKKARDIYREAVDRGADHAYMKWAKMMYEINKIEKSASQKGL